MDATNEISAENLLLKFDEIMSIAKAIEKASQPLPQIKSLVTSSKYINNSD